MFTALNLFINITYCIQFYHTSIYFNSSDVTLTLTVLISLFLSLLQFLLFHIIYFYILQLQNEGSKYNHWKNKTTKKKPKCIFSFGSQSKTYLEPQSAESYWPLHHFLLFTSLFSVFPKKKI